ncbi:hypothetical protein BGZ49_006820 [Haplosporangium sp. Z 27]|nr:hypothetical protein BGZ49_006820 [Haplosporangium sp. Z 27]
MIKIFDAPVRDASVYTKPVKRKLPYRKLYNVKVLDHATGTHPQALDTLKTSGPFQVWGWVPISETIITSGHHEGISSVTTEDGELIHVKAEDVIEWTHEFNSDNMMQPVFWVLSKNVCWYQIQSFDASYKPYLEPLSKVCTYLGMSHKPPQSLLNSRHIVNINRRIYSSIYTSQDVIIHSVLDLKVKDDLSELIPKAASILDMSIEMVSQELYRHRDQLIDLCSADSDLRKLGFYQQWVDERAKNLQNAIINDDTVISDSILSDSEKHLSPREPIDPLPTNDSIESEPKDEEQSATPAFLLETYERLPAPCTADICPIHFSKVQPTFGAISSELKALITDRFEQDGLGWSEPDTFHCPFNGCLASICNVVCRSSEEFIEEIVHHVNQHDLSTNDGKAIVMDYLKQTKRPIKYSPLRTSDPQKNLNLQLYWALKSGSFQFKDTPVIKSNKATTKTRAMSRKRPEGSSATQSSSILISELRGDHHKITTIFARIT